MSIVFASLVVAVMSSTAPPSEAGATLRGRVIDAISGSPVGGALVSAGDARATTGVDGRFDVALSEGVTELVVSADGFVDLTVSNLLQQHGPAELEISLFRRSQFSETVEVRAKTNRPVQPSSTTVEPGRVLDVAGSIDNVFRTLETLPGVAAIDDFGSRLTVRGGSPDQNLTVMDGVEIHDPYRLFGLTSAFNPETIESFELTAGGFSAKYGDRLSSLLVIRNRAGDAGARLKGSTSLSLTDANVILEGAIPRGPKGSWLVTGRRTYYDLVAERIVNDNLPSFGDLQAKVVLDLAPRSTLSVFGLRSREDTDLTFDSNAPGEFGALATNAGNDLVSMTWDSALGQRTTSRTVLSWYRNRNFLDFNGQIQDPSKRSNAPGDEAFGFSRVNFDRLLSVEDTALRQELAIQAGKTHFLETGFELHRLRTGIQFQSTGDRNEQEANGSSVRGGVGLPDSLDSALPSNRAGAWLQDRVSLGRSLSIEPGIRFDWSEANGRATVSPRLSAVLAAGPQTRVKGAVGLFTQSPGYEKLIQADYAIDLTDARRLGLRYERSTHLILGIERDLATGVTGRVEGFYKTFRDNLVGRLETEEERLARIARYDFPPELQDSIPTAPVITSSPSNDARGRAYGLDVYLERGLSAPDARLSGWVSYTWSRADREAYGRRYPFDYDRPHALNVVGSYRLTSKWRVALTGRLASGFPYTPPVGLRVAATEDPAGTGRLVPALDAEGRLVYTPSLGDVSDLNSGRLPFYARLDVRGSYRPRGAAGRFELYLEIINVLARKNAIRLEPRLAYDPAATVPAIVETPTEGFPLLPTFGLRFRF
jgi:TonB dependent receptor-like, beta-barrel/TonB-dependent Receptor Plug Domain/Carboxypeptidase regulatory-like domain